MKYTTPNWPTVFGSLRAYAEEGVPPSSSLFSTLGHDPFKILVTTVISLQTRDDITLKCAKAVLDQAASPSELLKLGASNLTDLLVQAGFYKTKVKNLLQICQILVDQHQGQVPKEADVLLALPGMGRKAVNLILQMAFGIKAICVDANVLRIANRIGWIKADTAEAAEVALQKILPEEYWVEANELLVTFGQDICKAASPLCSECDFKGECPKIGVHSAR